VRDRFSWSAAHAPAIGASEIGRRPGETLTVRFHCLRSFKHGGFLVLEADGAEFDVAIPLEVFRSLPGSLDFSGQTNEATGLVDLYKGCPQIMIGVPIQI